MVASFILIQFFYTGNLKSSLICCQYEQIKPTMVIPYHITLVQNALQHDGRSGLAFPCTLQGQLVHVTLHFFVVT